MEKLTRRSLLRTSAGLAAAGAIGRPYIVNAAATTATVWWVQGFAQEEDIAFKQMVEDYQKASGNTIDYSIVPFAGETDIFITPGYRFRAIDVLMTNFHLPRSTLFMLVSAFSGLEVMQRAYAHAIAAGYRFYSYGDACLLFRA